MLTRWRIKRRNRSRGAALIEAAIVAPVFFMIIFAIIEFGFLFRNYLTIGSVTSETARTAAIRGNDPDADYQTLQTFFQAFQAWDVRDFDVLVIYKATGPDDPVPPSCISQSSAALECNRYTVADLYKPPVDGSTTNFGGCPTEPESLDKYWCPLDRDATLEGGVDLIGIYVEGTHKYLTGFFGDDATLSYTQVIRIEPERTK